MHPQQQRNETNGLLQLWEQIKESKMECAIQTRYMDRTQKTLECGQCLFKGTDMCECEESEDG